MRRARASTAPTVAGSAPAGMDSPSLSRRRTQCPGSALLGQRCTAKPPTSFPCRSWITQRVLPRPRPMVCQSSRSESASGTPFAAAAASQTRRTPAATSLTWNPWRVASGVRSCNRASRAQAGNDRQLDSSILRRDLGQTPIRSSKTSRGACHRLATRWGISPFSLRSTAFTTPNAPTRQFAVARRAAIACSPLRLRPASASPRSARCAPARTPTSRPRCDDVSRRHPSRHQGRSKS